MKYVLSCTISAILGALIAVQIAEPRPLNTALAQERPRIGPTLPAQPPPRRPRPPALQASPIPGRPVEPSELDDDFDLAQLTPEERNNVAVYERVNKSVVNITTKGVRADAVFLIDLPTEGAGSGSILDKLGHVLTNFHVVEEARQVSVTLYDGKSYDARFIGADPINDTAVIKIEAPPETLFPVEFGDSRRLKVGMRVFAIGNPFGLERTLTTGIISSLNRSLQIHSNRTIKSIIQIDAAINPGSSGGPLLDTHARLIGINTAIASKTGQSSGVGFAIPVNLIARIVPQLIQHGKVVRPDIGIARVYETEEGLLIAKLIPGGPAERAGLQGPKLTSRRRGPFVVQSIDRSAADLITAINGHKVTTGDDFLGHVEAHDPGDSVTLTIVRQNRELSVQVRLATSAEMEAAEAARK